MRQSVGGNVHAEIDATDAGMLLTDTELVYINVSGMQRAKLSDIAKVSREDGELVISSTERPLIRGAIKTDKETLSNFFSQVRQVAAWSRERRTVIMDSPSATPMDSSFVGRTPDAPIQRPDLPDPIAEMPVSAPTRPVITVSQSLDNATNPFLVPPPLPQNQALGQNLGRTTTPAMPRAFDENQDRPRVIVTPAPRLSESRNEAVKLGYAGFWLRALAYFIDLVILTVAGGIISAVFSGGQAASALGVGSIANIIFTWLYFAFLESGERQGTLGKMALGLIVTDQNNQRLSFLRATGRYFARLVPLLTVLLGYLVVLPVFSIPGDTRGNLALLAGVSFLITAVVLLSYIMAGFTAKKQALHDLIAKTLVYKK